MKFFWKIFLSIMLITVLFFSIGVFYIIRLNFKYSLNMEILTAYKENEILIYTLNNEMQSNIKEQPVLFEGDIEHKERWIMNLANSVAISTSKGIMPFRISNSRYNIIYESKWSDIDNDMLKKLPENSRGYEITLVNDMYHIHTAAPLTILGEKLYVENYLNITSLFKNRDLQYRTCFYLMIVMIIIGSIIIFVVTTWLTKPIRKLSIATKRFARGDFSQRVNIKGEDELSLLSEDFNSMAERLAQTMGELKDAANRQEAFVNNFAHELKTPLTSIIGYADMLRSKKMDNNLVIESANYIFEEGKRLESLSMKLMDIIILNNQTFTLQKIDSCSFLESIEGAYRPIFKKNNIEFIVKCEKAAIYIEPDLIKTVCINLLDNARKAITQNGKVSIIGRKTDQGYSISVYDNGRGMEESEISRITEAFYMVDKSRSRAQGGAGLGLSICSEIIKLHGGFLTFQSTPKEGTCATICLKGDDKECLG